MQPIGTYLRWHRRPRPDPRIERPLREALLALCYERGFRDLTPAGLCQRAGVSEVQFHRLYEDLEDCFAHVYEDLAHHFLLRLFATFDADLDWRRQIRAVAHDFLHYLTEDHPRAHLTVVDSLNAGDRALIIRDSVFAGLFALIDQGRAQMPDPDALTPATASSVGGAIFLQVRIAVEERRFAELPQMVPGFMYSVVLPYLGPQAAAEELMIPPSAAALGPVSGA
jgi:AcrR family transcriptional regulator